ncbi:MAG: helix-turn-helix domain-containing protein [bacterium]|nr:helix-turn-helix domain-containing protein [bacterium]
MSRDEDESSRRDMWRLGSVLRSRRDELGLSVQNVIDRTGNALSMNAYRGTENGQLRRISGWRIKIIAKALDLDPAWLAEQAGYPVRPPSPPN